MKTLRIASLVMAGILAVAPAALAGGFGDVSFPGGRWNQTGNPNTAKLKAAPSSAPANFYTSAEQTRAKHWHVHLDWNGYPFGLAVVND